MSEDNGIKVEPAWVRAVEGDGDVGLLLGYLIGNDNSEQPDGDGWQSADPDEISKKTGLGVEIVEYALIELDGLGLAHLRIDESEDGDQEEFVKLDLGALGRMIAASS